MAYLSGKFKIKDWQTEMLSAYSQTPVDAMITLQAN